VRTTDGENGRVVASVRGDPAMDAVFLLITAAFFAASWGFVLLCERI
jgi:hypothetical protein